MICRSEVFQSCAYGLILAWGEQYCLPEQAKQTLMAGGGGGHQKNFPDIPKKFSGHIMKFPLTSRNFREKTKNFSGQKYFTPHPA